MEREKQKESFRTIHLMEVKVMLGLKGKGFRTVLEWCKKHKIPILGSAKRRRVLESDWMRVQKLAYIKAVRYTFPNWRELLAAKGIIIQEGTSSKTTSEPQTAISKNFMKGRAA